MTKPKTKPRVAAHLIDMIIKLSAARPKRPEAIQRTTDELARVLYLHECLGGDRATFARVTGLPESTIRTIAASARAQGLH